MDIFTLLMAIIAYLIGAIPTGYLIAQWKGIADIRQHGSGNIGATNIARVLGTQYFFLIFLLDAGKSYAYITILKNYSNFDYNTLYFFAGILLLGNVCSIFLRGSGGKGVATAVGLLAALQPQTLLFSLAIWAVILVITRTVGIASVVAVALLPLYVYITIGNNAFFAFCCFATGLILWKHTANIQAYWKKKH